MLRELSSAPLVPWGNAWLSGHAGLDDAVDAVEHRTGPNVIGTAPEELPVTSGTPLRSALAGLRPEGLTAFRLCLPVPGDPLGLVGTAELNMAAIEAREAVLLQLGNQQIGIVPSEDRRGSSYVGVSWTPYPAADTIPETPQLSEAEHALTHAMRNSAALFQNVDDITGWGKQASRALADLRDPKRTPEASLAPGHPQRAHRLAAQADRLAVVVQLASDGTGRGLSATQMHTRNDALRVLDSAVRRARVAAYGAAAAPH